MAALPFKHSSSGGKYFISVGAAIAKGPHQAGMSSQRCWCLAEQLRRKVGDADALDATGKLCAKRD